MSTQKPRVLRHRAQLKALGLYHAIWWIHELQLTNVDFEVDSKKVAA